MIFTTLSSLAFSAILAHGALVAPVSSAADTLPFDTTQVVVTQNDLNQLKSFLEATSSEWEKKGMHAMCTRHLVYYPLALGDLGGATAPPRIRSGTPIPIPNYQVIADSTPNVAKGLAAARLSASRYMQLSRTLNDAYLTEQLDKLLNKGTLKSTETTSVIGQNVAFIRANQAAFDDLVKLALDVEVIPPPQGGGGDDDQNP